MDSRQLSIPIYLNQRVVFDLLATVEGGFSQLQTVRSAESSTRSSRGEASAEIGTSNVFAFLGIGLKGGKAKDSTEQSQRDVTVERVFTPASLFSRMRDVLIERKLLVEVDTEAAYTALFPGNFVEFSATLRKNPLVEALEAFIRLVDFLSVFDVQPTATSGAQRKPSGKEMNSPKSDLAKSMKMVKGLLGDLTASQTLDLVASLEGARASAIVPVELDYFADRTPAAIIDGQYVVLGKVVRTTSAEHESIDLLRGTSLGSMSKEMVDTLKEAFAAAGASGIKFPEIVTEVRSPAILVIPIGIYA